MLLLALDFETTGLNTAEDHVIEVGAVIYSTNLDQTLQMSGYFVDHEVPIPEIITQITGIRRSMIDKFGVSSKQALSQLLNMVEEVDAIVGQNIVDFDIPLARAWAQREGEVWPERLLIDTKTDLPGVQSKHLGYMAADAGFLNPFPHRAVSDCLTVLKLIARHNGKDLPTTFDDVVVRAKSPRLTIAAQVDFDHNKLAKERKYIWHPERRVWYKQIKEIDLDREVKEAPFDIAKIEPIPLHG